MSNSPSSTDSPVYLAVDLGASSGRVIAGVVVDGRLELDAVHRFANDPVRLHDSLQWDVVGLWGEILAGLRLAAGKYSSVRSVGVDTWGVDYVLVDRNDQFAGSVHHYRDARTRGMVEKSFETVPRADIFAATGVQFMEINTLYQLLAAVQAGDPALGVADRFLMMGDFFHWLLSGKAGNEITNASTSQLLDPETRTWSETLVSRFGLPAKLFAELIQPGTNLGPVQPSVQASTGLGPVPVVVPGTHDTASAVLAVPAGEFAPPRTDWCYISSGTWSLMGVERAKPMVTPLCAELNFTNEAGVGDSTRLLKNIGGLWVFQQIRQSLERRGQSVSWDQMVAEAETAEPFTLLIDPDSPHFVAPDDMIDAIESFAASSGQPKPASRGVLCRSALESLALRYRVCLGMLESLVGNSIDTIHIVGGGSVNALLCQMTADACNRTVVAGPVEATAVGNVLMQMIGLGDLDGFDAARALVRASFQPVRYDPISPQRWDAPAERFASLG